jgi:hypothetical protein
MATTPQFPMPQRPTPQSQAPAPAASPSGFAQWAQSRSKWFWLAAFVGVFVVGTVIQWFLAPTPKPQGAQEQNPRATTGVPAEAPKADGKSVK